MRAAQEKALWQDPLLNGHLFYLGRIDGGQSSEDILTIKIPGDWLDGTIPLHLVFEEYNGFVPDQLQAVLNLKGLPRFRFGYMLQVIDDGTGNSVGTGDGSRERTRVQFESAGRWSEHLHRH